MIPSQKPRVMIIIGSLAIGGGAEKVAAALGTMLTERGYEAHLVTFYEEPEKFAFKGTYHSFNETIRGSRFMKLLNLPWRLWYIRQYAQEHKIEVIVSFLEEANFYALIAKMVFFMPQPTIVSVRINILRREWPFRFLSYLLYPLAQKVVSVTRGVARILERDFKLSNVITIYNPLELSTIPEKAEEPLPKSYRWLEERTPRIISNGRYTYQKGQWHLIRAFAKVRVSYPNAVLAILGDGEYRENLTKLIQDSGLTENVFLLGRHHNVFRFLRTADVFVFTSLYEGMPNAMLEAFAMGLPIVSAECVSGPREILAPELDVEEQIEYPYRTQAGILTSPLSPGPVWNPIEVVPLTPEEIELADAIEEALRKEVAGATKDLLKPYVPDTVFDAWENVILGALKAH